MFWVAIGIALLITGGLVWLGSWISKNRGRPLTPEEHEHAKHHIIEE
jgi:hypothetical protein